MFKPTFVQTVQTLLFVCHFSACDQISRCEYQSRCVKCCSLNVLLSKKQVCLCSRRLCRESYLFASVNICPVSTVPILLPCFILTYLMVYAGLILDNNYLTIPPCMNCLEQRIIGTIMLPKGLVSQETKSNQYVYVTRCAPNVMMGTVQVELVT